MIAEPAETDMNEVARGSLEGLARPIYLACGNDREQQCFLQDHGLARHEVLRVRHAWQVPATCKEGKVLVLAPRWAEDRATDAFVHWWVDCDRYTCAMEASPLAVDEDGGLWGEDDDEARELRGLIGLARWMGVACCVVVAVCVFRDLDAGGWTVAACGWWFAWAAHGRTSAPTGDRGVTTATTGEGADGEH